MSKSKPTPGRTVLYVLNKTDADAINRRRTTTGGEIADRIKTDKWPLGAQAHIGNAAAAGDVYPMTIVRVWGEGDNPAVNGQVLLDGNDTYWATSRHENEAKEQGTYHWPERS